ncbi:hypothetical protein [Mucilaginibacter flavus]|uniref:hypothetical protein n=1 Tax=Mucilaginibacter flavus TaxID=931504 RepID=UPI0025B39321|nr:hypothetical protein [Mucilaginibacter flavus]MDN3583895.1 hypothetical protein [Mucilaginibacter flavus]
MPYPAKQKPAPRAVVNRAEQRVPPSPPTQTQRKLKVGKTLMIIGIILIALAAAYYWTQRTNVSFEFTRKVLHKPNEATIEAFHITITNTGNKAIVIKNLDVIQGLNGDDLYDQFKWEYMGKTLKPRQTLQWDMEFGNKNLRLLSFRVQLTAADGKVYSSWRQEYKK